MRLISRASPKGGVGKTMLAANLAHDLQHLGWKLDDRLIGVVYRDEYLGEAVASQRLVADFAPESKASYDIASLAANVDAMLAGSVGFHSMVAAS